VHVESYDDRSNQVKHAKDGKDQRGLRSPAQASYPAFSPSGGL
jgi:hypothetical protein